MNLAHNGERPYAFCFSVTVTITPSTLSFLALQHAAEAGLASVCISITWLSKGGAYPGLSPILTSGKNNIDVELSCNWSLSRTVAMFSHSCLHTTCELAKLCLSRAARLYTDFVQGMQSEVCYPYRVMCFVADRFQLSMTRLPLSTTSRLIVKTSWERFMYTTAILRIL